MKHQQFFSFQDMHDIIIGSHFYASGGGGALENGQQLISRAIEILKENNQHGIQYLSPGVNIPDTIWTPFVGAVGSPARYLSEGFEQAPSRALECHRKAMAYRTGEESFSFGAITAIESGTLTYGMTMLLAAQQRLPVIDGDGCGRAVPVLPMVGPALDSPFKPNLAPVALVSELDESEGGSQLVIDTENPANLNEMMHGIITYDPGFDQRSALSCYATQGASLNTESPGFIVPGAMSRALDLGRLIREKQDDEPACIEAVLQYTGGRHIARAAVTEINATTNYGFDYVTVQLVDEQQHHYSVFVKNESLLVQRNDDGAKPVTLAIAPELICYLLPDGRTITNAELPEALERYKQDSRELIINIFALPSQKELNESALSKLFQEELEGMGCQLH